MERTEVRIVAGSLKGRKVVCMVHEGMRPTPQMVREALFSILGNAVPERVFYDVFAGTGINGLEAISRGASSVTFLERDPKLSGDIEKYLARFEIREKGTVVRTDVYRWAERWVPPRQPINVFVSPPFPDLSERHDEFLKLIAMLREKMADESVLVLQVEDGFDLTVLGDIDNWDVRKYGRNLLLFLVKGIDDVASEPETTDS